MRPTGNPYRLAPPRALAPASRPPGRLLTLWLDVVGAAYVLWWWRHARDCNLAAQAGQNGWLWRYRQLGPWGWPPPPHVDPTPTVRIPASAFDAALTGAPPRVATGEVNEPARLDVGALVDAADAKWGPLVEAASEPWPPFRRVSAETYRHMAEEMVKHLGEGNDEARANARKE